MTHDNVVQLYMNLNRIKLHLVICKPVQSDQNLCWPCSGKLQSKAKYRASIESLDEVVHIPRVVLICTDHTCLSVGFSFLLSSK